MAFQTSPRSAQARPSLDHDRRERARKSRKGHWPQAVQLSPWLFPHRLASGRNTVYNQFWRSLASDNDLSVRGIMSHQSSPDHRPDPHDLAAMHRLLREKFSAPELRRLCLHSPQLRFLLDHFGPGFSKLDMIDAILVECEDRHLPALRGAGCGIAEPLRALRALIRTASPL